MRYIYLAYPMTTAETTAAAMLELGQWFRKMKRYKVHEPVYELFTEALAEKTIERLDQCSHIVADLSQTSHGVGFEVGYAFSKGKKVYIVANLTERDKLSKFITSLFGDIIYYKDGKDLIQIFDSIISSKKL
ncbi:hypothetical protein GSUET_15080 [Geobacter sulfurreducens subsp. ethanolicus]|uniref:nucleoside 2-deoxyribosyltransferase n=1 Tax=Geobacter sulfurreducens TaxID=35554 RepID=UPI002572684A|nr:nucleoside 2-deoxyribosyltransferase [Geobacter sulfurreducens]BEH09896.1 hypothetical protein GSUET_15080 [Geobacter sulfurreducens subsp. ethanolicus]